MRSVTLAVFFIAFGRTAISQTMFEVIGVHGKAVCRPSHASAWQTLRAGCRLLDSDRIHTAAGAVVRILVNGERVITIDQNRRLLLSGNLTIIEGDQELSTASPWKITPARRNRHTFPGAPRGMFTDR